MGKEVVVNVPEVLRYCHPTSILFQGTYKSISRVQFLFLFAIESLNSPVIHKLPLNLKTLLY